MPQQWGRAIRFLRAARGMTGKDLADRAKLDQSYLSLLETGRRRNPSPETIAAIARALGAREFLLSDLSNVDGLRRVDEARSRLVADELLAFYLEPPKKTRKR